MQLAFILSPSAPSWFTVQCLFVCLSSASNQSSTSECLTWSFPSQLVDARSLSSSTIFVACPSRSLADSSGPLGLTHSGCCDFFHPGALSNRLFQIHRRLDLPPRCLARLASSCDLQLGWAAFLPVYAGFCLFLPAPQTQTENHFEDFRTLSSLLYLNFLALFGYYSLC